MKEIGSFIDLELPLTDEWYSEKRYGKDIARLNSGRAAIYYACRCLNISTVYLPRYQCDTVRDFLLKKNIEVRYYNINSDYEPIHPKNEDDTAFLIVNYYGVMNSSRMQMLASKYKNVIIDNSQAFFAKPIEGCMNVYSARKFVGVPDGAYVIGKNASAYIDEYPESYSSDTALFLLQRIEYGCEGKTYQNRTENEKRIDRIGRAHV